MAGGSLSALSDELLRRILYFTPAKEAASTAVLSRRWRSLWRTSGAVNLDSRSYERAHGYNARRAFARGIEATLAAAADGGSIIRRLTLHVDESCYPISSPGALGPGLDVVATLLSSPAAVAVEELRVVLAARRGAGPHPHVSLPHLSFGSLPSESLRALHIACIAKLTPPPPGAAFPRLADLRLRSCGVSLDDLQLIVDAAPQLATLHLEHQFFGVNISHKSETDDDRDYRLACPAVAVLVLADCSWLCHEGGLELDVPRLQYFRCKGAVELYHRLSLKLSASPIAIRADLHFVQSGLRNEGIRVHFWESLQNFKVAKVLRLKLDLETGHVAVADKDDQDRLLGDNLFHNLQRLELEVPCGSASKTPAPFIANLLHCCPEVRDLHVHCCPEASKGSVIGLQNRSYSFLTRKSRSDFNESIDHFRHRRRPKNFLGGDDDENYEVSDIPCLSGHSFNCLQSYLRTVSLQFWMDEPNCFGVQLAKFFAENATVLQEISIDDGNHKMCKHMNHTLRRCITSSSKRKNSLTTTAFGESHTRKRHRGVTIPGLP